MSVEAWYGILIPFLGTALGSACVFLMKKAMGDRLQRALTGFAAGVMVAASIWSLLLPAMEQAESMGKLVLCPGCMQGFGLALRFCCFLDHLIPHLHRNCAAAEGPKSRLQRNTMLVLAVTLHNIPEGMAVGVVYAGYLAGDGQISAAGSSGPLPGHCHSEFSGGRHHFYAPSGGGDGMGPRLSFGGFCPEWWSRWGLC